MEVTDVTNRLSSRTLEIFEAHRELMKQEDHFKEDMKGANDGTLNNYECQKDAIRLSI